MQNLKPYLKVLCSREEKSALESAILISITDIFAYVGFVKDGKIQRVLLENVRVDIQIFGVSS